MPINAGEMIDKMADQNLDVPKKVDRSWGSFFVIALLLLTAYLLRENHILRNKSVPMDVYKTALNDAKEAKDGEKEAKNELNNYKDKQIEEYRAKQREVDSLRAASEVLKYNQRNIVKSYNSSIKTLKNAQ